MGNCFRRCVGGDDVSDDGRYPGHYVPHPGPPTTFEYNVVAFTALAPDLRNFEATRKVPIALKDFVAASKATQIIWYEKLLAAWRRAKPPPATAEEVAVLVVEALKGYNFQGLLQFYHLPWPKPSKPKPSKPTGKPPTGKPPTGKLPSGKPPEVIVPETGGTWPEGVEFEIRTLPVGEKDVRDGDGMNVYVDVYGDTRELENLPIEIQDAVDRRGNARARRDFKTADALQTQIEKAEYKVFDGKKGGIQCLARKYRIRLKGVDAPERDQAYGKESMEKLDDLVKGHRLLIHVYENDQYGRAVGDVHLEMKGIFIQEALLKEGCVWHYKSHDKRQSFAQWERDAKAARRGLWADDYPEKPWDWRRKHKRKPMGQYARERGA